MKLILLLLSVLLSELLVSATDLDSRSTDDSLHRRSRSIEDSLYFYYQEPEYPRDCKEIYEQCDDRTLDSGVYLIKPVGADEPFEVYCNNTIDGGGWTVLQRRVDGSVGFYRYWNDYKHGFGFLSSEFWLGNDKIALLTNQKDYELRIDITDRHGTPYFAKYALFRISDEWSKYKLVNIDGYDSSSTVGNNSPLSFHKNKLFSTRDQDNDGWDSYHCAEKHVGAWWFGHCWVTANPTVCDTYDDHCELFPVGGGGCVQCGTFHPNSDYDGSIRGTNIFWDNLDGGGNNDCGLIFTDMKIRPV